MSKIFSFILIILLTYIFTQRNISEFYNKPIDSSQDNDLSISECFCDTNRNSCNYLCCCDKKCKQTITDEWRKRLKCIDEKDTSGIFADRCIDHNLVVYFDKKEESKRYRRRGLKRDEATEDISKSKETIKNYCFSMDNSDKMKQKLKPMVLDINKIKEYYSSPKSDNIVENNKKYLLLNEENEEYQTFISDGKFALYSSSNCDKKSLVEKFKNANYSCLMNKEENKKIINEIKYGNFFFGDTPCLSGDLYKIEKGLINFEPSNDDINDDDWVLEVEFVIQMNDFEKVENCSINIVKSSEIGKNSAIFKNSVIFTKNNSVIPYRYSGNNGYLNGSPLKIANGTNIFNEFYIVGRDKDGNCRMDGDIYNYSYFYDKPLLFNQNFSYSCNLNNSSISSLDQTTLFKKLKEINKIAKYGNSRISQNDDSNFWINIDKTNFNGNNLQNTSIKMNVYLGTRKVGINSYKYIYYVTLKNNNSTKKDILSLNINYYDLDKKQEYETKPEIPAFIPSMPADLLDPLIYSKVDK